MSAGLEVGTLAECEAVIERGLATFVDVGGALLRIRDERLYLSEYGDFDTYCQTRWGFTRSYAYRQIDAATIVRELSPMGDTALPTSERQARELVGLEPEDAADVMRHAEVIGDGKVTASAIREARHDLYDEDLANALNAPFDDDPPLTQAECEALDESGMTDAELAQQAERMEAESRVTGVDGKSYPAVKPRKPNRKPITDAARSAGWELRKTIERIERLVEDDRLSRNKNEVAVQLSGHLTYAIETCQGILDRLASA